MEYLNLIEDEFWPLYLRPGLKKAYLLHLPSPFITVKHLYLSGAPGLQVTRALRGLTWESVAEVWPTLQSVFLEGLQPSEDVVEAIGPFIVRQHISGSPVTVHSWDREELMYEEL